MNHPLHLDQITTLNALAPGYATAMLEVAEKRMSIKKQQTRRSDNSGLPAYICATEFGTPKASYVKK